MKYTPLFALCAATLVATGARAETLVFDQPELAGMSGLRAHWDRPIPVAEDGARRQVDAVVQDRGQTAVWDGEQPGPLAFDAVHRHLLVRFPGAAARIAAALADGKRIATVELVLPYLDEELWPQGRLDFPSADGYRYRMNWGVDKLWRERRPNWHAVAHALRKPWTADADIGPTYNAAIDGAVYWNRFGASCVEQDRFPAELGPAEVSSYNPAGRMDVTAVLTDEAYGATLAERLRVLADHGFVLQKWEVYDARFMVGSDAYEWATGSGPRAILIRRPSLVVTLEPGERQAVGEIASVDVATLAARHRDAPLGAPTAVVPSPEAVERLNAQFLAQPDWMLDWQYAHVRQLMGLESGGEVKPFYYRTMPGHVANRAIEEGRRAAREVDADFNPDYAVYLAWLDWMHGERPRSWQGHLTAQRTVTWWYTYKDAIPGPVRDSILRSWRAWLMPERATAMTDRQRRDFTDTSGKLVHPMADDPRVGVAPDGTTAEWNQGYTYYRKTGDWRGNKSYYRSGFTRMISTANFNSSATSGALLAGQIIGSEHAIADGRAGLWHFPFWMWTHNAGVGQEYIDHYYWAIATAGNKLFPDYAEDPADRMAGWSIIAKTVNDLAGAYHPNLKKVIGPASRTFIEHVLGRQDGLYHILHMLSPQGALIDVESGRLPALSANPERPASAWGHDYPAAEVAIQSLSGPWAEPWFAELVDEKPLPWSSMVEKKMVAEGDWVTTHFGVNYGLSSIRLTPQRIHVLGHWRRAPERPTGMRDVGTLDMRIGYNETRIAEDGAGVISHQGRYRTYQDGGRVIMLARPNTAFLGQRQDVRSVQCTAALFNYEQPEPGWELYVDDRRIEMLPATARFGQVVLVRDGVTYLALRPLPSDDHGRSAEVVIEAGTAQEPAYHNGIRIEPAVLVHAYLAKSDDVMAPASLAGMETAQTGFVVEIGDAAEYGSFERFRAHIAAASLAVEAGPTVTYRSGDDVLTASWDAFTVNGIDPYAAVAERHLWQDTSLSQMGRGRLEKNGASIERDGVGNLLVLQTLPRQNRYVAMNLLPDYQAFTFREPGGVSIAADGLLSMGRWSIKDSREIDILYHAFEAWGGQVGDWGADAGADAIAEKDLAHTAPPVEDRATALFISGAPDKPRVTLNGRDVSETLEPAQHAGAAAWRLPLVVRGDGEARQ